MAISQTLTNPAKDVDANAWHRRTVEDVARDLITDVHHGLTPEEAARRIALHGANVIAEGRRRGWVRMLFDQFTDLMIVILLAAAVISGFIGDAVDTVVILAIVVLNAAVGFVQEYRAERAIAALKQMAAPNARVVRGAQTATIASADLVPGDVVLLEAGNIVPADLRLVEAHTLKTEEAALTGESQPVDKRAAALPDADLSLGDRRNMAYKGTLVTYGRGRGIVGATGMQTELGKIAGLIAAAQETRTPLQRRLTHFGRVIAVAVIALCVVLFGVGVLRGEPILLMALTAISLAVAAIPEALPAVVTVALALGARKMVRANALIRRLPAVETLGSVTYICSDKTGTLTENRMRVEEAWCDGEQTAELAARRERAPWSTLIAALALSNDARPGDAGAILGDPTEVALYVAAANAGADKAALLKTAPRVAELPFDSERSRMTTFHRAEAGYLAYTKGAPESVLPLCDHALGHEGAVRLNAAAVGARVQRMAAEGLRVLAVAMRAWSHLPEARDPKHVERHLTFVGLVGLLDPPRAEAKEAVRLCRTAGITPVMITGDHPATARAIAERLDIAEPGATVLTGRELERLSAAELEAQVERVRVYARVAPQQKIKIVQALQDQGEFVAMTGDGVNDAPALKRADIGVAMGITGTDVAKEAGHMILLDDNFATIVRAVREGRRIFDNIRKFIKFVMTGNSGELVTLILAPFLGLPIPLLPIHILWVNLVTDGLPGLALAVEPAERGIMERPPRPPQESIFAHGMWQHIVWVGLLIGALCLVTQAGALQSDDAHWQTMVFTVLTLSQMFHALAIRSERDSLIRQGLRSNLPLLAAVVFTFLLQLGLIYLPWLNAVFQTAPLTAAELGFCIGASAIVLFAVEIEKALVRAGVLYRTQTAAAPVR
jgi:P-type Ca2+ transporter type 2C